MSTELKITDQELKIINYLNSKTDQEVPWEELAQFAKDPQSVKLKTIKKSVSEIRRKYSTNNLPVPFNVRFISLVEKPATNVAPVISPKLEPEQKLVRVALGVGGALAKKDETKHQAQIDFALDHLGFKKVRTRYGSHQLNDNEWDVFKYFYANPGKLISLSELRDNVVFPNYGSKLPARWFDSIMRIVNNMRKQVVGLDKRLLTVKGQETSYIFQ